MLQDCSGCTTRHYDFIPGVSENKTKQNKNKTKQNKNKTKQNKTKQNKTKTKQNKKQKQTKNQQKKTPKNTHPHKQTNKHGFMLEILVGS